METYGWGELFPFLLVPHLLYIPTLHVMILFFVMAWFEINGG